MQPNTQPRPQSVALCDQVDADPPEWASAPILAWDEHYFREIEPFVRRYYWDDNIDIDVAAIVGTRHPDYQGKAWQEFLHSGKRMETNLPLHAENPGYYLDQGHKLPTMSFVTLDEKHFYVDSDGNHRSAIAKFDFHYRGRKMLHGVSVRRYDVDFDLYETYKAMSRWIEDRDYQDPWRVEPYSQILAREDDAGWKVDRYETAILLTDRRTNEQQRLDARVAKARLTQWQVENQDITGPGLFRKAINLLLKMWS